MGLELVSDDVKTYQPVDGCAIRYRCINPRTLKQLTRACVTDERGLRIDEELLTRKVLAWAIVGWDGVTLDGQTVEPDEETIDRLPPAIYMALEVLVMSRGGIKKVLEASADASAEPKSTDEPFELTVPEGGEPPLSPLPSTSGRSKAAAGRSARPASASTKPRNVSRRA